ncbi:DSBA-like thioredoxin domain-containing protein [Apiospora rasikravindrae]|uniref:DSBA-like thioredoxin domain-containing protein n=1 Tax=Apiospora rasikravindrae TaxID=990691 RepID=A0ABR1U7L8_9PEZI
MTNFKIDIISDNVCPFCYLGKVRLEKAIEKYKQTYPGGADDTFTLTWKPFYLDPTSPAKGMPIQERMAQKFGGPERAAQMQRQLAHAGRLDGVEFTGRGLVGNTRDSHRVVELGRSKGHAVQNAVILELFKSYFSEGGDITSHDMLVAAAEKAGIEPAETRAWLKEGKGGEEVDAMVQEAYAKNVSGVPHITIQGKYEISGAQDPEIFLKAIRAAKEQSAAEVSSSGGQC